MKELEYIILKAKQDMKKKKITQNKLAQELGMSVTTVNNALNLKNVTIDSLKAILKYIEEN
ncbi:MAG: helix-turn-helix domain-containing protein [Cetobacterium sp.]